MNFRLFVIFAICVALSAGLSRITIEDRKNTVVVPSGTKLARTEDGMKIFEPNGIARFHSPSVQGHHKRTINSGLVTSLWATGTAYNYFRSYWLVPPNPTSTSDGQELYFFSALENSGETEILQPYLEWSSGKWTVTASYGYYVSSSESYQFYSSTLATVNPGDSIKAVIQGLPVSYPITSWTISVYVNYALASSISISTSYVSNVLEYAYFGLEQYYVVHCTSLPPSEYISFTFIDLLDSNKTSYPTWSNYTYASPCTVGNVPSTKSETIPILTWVT